MRTAFCKEFLYREISSPAEREIIKKALCIPPLSMSNKHRLFSVIRKLMRHFFSANKGGTAVNYRPLNITCSGGFFVYEKKKKHIFIGDIIEFIIDVFFDK